MVRSPKPICSSVGFQRSRLLRTNLPPLLRIHVSGKNLRVVHIGQSHPILSNSCVIQVIIYTTENTGIPVC